MIDIEAALIRFVNDLNAGYQAFGDVPRPRPNSFVTVERTGGGFSDFTLDHSTVAVQCWAKTRAQAAHMARWIDERIRTIPDDIANICTIERDGLYNWPDETGNNARYQIIYNITTQ